MFRTATTTALRTTIARSFMSQSNTSTLFRSFHTTIRPLLSQSRLQSTKNAPYFDLSKIPRYDPSKPRSIMKSYTQHFPSESDPVVRLDFDGESCIWVLTMLGKDTPDNRVTHKMIGEAFLPALLHVEAKWNDMANSGEAAEGAAFISTGGADASAKIYSNGLDFETAVADPTFFDRHLNALYEKLLTFPIPTIAAVNGHAFAAGFGLICSHDYRVMNAKRGYLCMNEIDFGAPLPHGLQQALANKISDQKTMRKIVLEGHRFSAKEAADAGIVDVLSESTEDTLAKAKELAEKLKGKAKMNAWGLNKEVIYASAIKVLRTKHQDATDVVHATRAKY